MWLKTSCILPVLSAHEGPSPSNIISVFTLNCPVSSMKIVFKLHFSPLIPARPAPLPPSPGLELLLSGQEQGRKLKIPESPGQSRFRAVAFVHTNSLGS